MEEVKSVKFNTQLKLKIVGNNHRPIRVSIYNKLFNK